MGTKSSNRVRGALVAALLAGTTLGGLAATGYAQDTQPSTAPATAAAPIQPTGTLHPLPDFTDLAAQVSPAVVSVTVREDGGQGEARGSGFIIDPNGTVVTNNHVVAGRRAGLHHAERRHRAARQGHRPRPAQRPRRAARSMPGTSCPRWQLGNSAAFGPASG